MDGLASPLKLKLVKSQRPQSAMKTDPEFDR
jgi:hypothetical protein